MDISNMYSNENRALRLFVSALGFDPVKVIAELGEGGDFCRLNALRALVVERDFSTCGFSDAGVDAGNRWLDSLTRSA